MCGRTWIDKLFREKVSQFHLKKIKKDIQTNFNLAPSQDIPVIIYGSRILDSFRWGLIPFWAKDEKIGYKTINCRAETIKEKKTYMNAFHSHRCIVLVSGFFEWKNKQPYAIKLKDESLMPFAGLYSYWKDKKGNEIGTCTIVTTEANKSMKKFHSRMPVILNEKDIDFWINPNNRDFTKLLKLLKPNDKIKVIGYKVSKDVNKVSINKESNLEKV